MILISVRSVHVIAVMQKVSDTKNYTIIYVSQISVIAGILNKH